MAKYAGKNGLIYMSSSAGSAASLVGSLSSWSMDLSTDKLDSTEFGATNETQEIGFPKGQGTFEGFYNDSGQSQLWAARSSSDGSNVYLYPSTSAPTKFLSLNAWVDVSIQTGVKDMVKIRGTLSARGNIAVNL
jgi:hypothetical protein